MTYNKPYEWRVRGVGRVRPGDDRFLGVCHEDTRMNRRRFVAAMTVSLAGCSTPEDDGGSDDGGSGPYGKVGARPRPDAP
jgi:hypothetical protein